MSNQIQDLIANIEQKFDNQFNSTAGDQSSASKSQNIDKDVKDSVNPQSQLAKSLNSSTFQAKTQKKQDIVIEQHQNQSNSNLDRNQSNLHRRVQQTPDNHHNEHEQQNNHQDEQQDQNKYKDLSKKLQTALKKISSSKKGFQSFNSYTSTTSDFINRAEQYQRKKQRDLQMKRKMQEQKKVYGLKAKPEINPKSRQMATQTSYRPIYQRYQKIVQQKKKKLQTNIETKKTLEQQQYEKYLQQFKKHTKLQPQNCRDSTTYFNDMMVWKKKVDKEKQQKMKQKTQKQTEGYTFKPEINKKSIKLTKNHTRVPIQDRQIQRPKTQQSQYTFQPKINKRRVN